MRAFDYADARVPVREEIRSVHLREWQKLARPGAWWSGRERVAIAAAVRGSAACSLCAERRGVVSPLALQGRHDHDGVLPDAAVEMVHQVAADPGRLSRAWFEKVAADGVSPERYVEALGVIVVVVNIDGFCRGVGVEPPPLPEPVAGEPSRYRPAAAAQDVGWVPMIPSGQARGAEADLYPGPRAPNVLRAMSLVPEAVRSLHALSAVHYLTIREVPDPRARRILDRAQMELLAGRVSALSECFY
jgi:hypothetical protein